MPLSHKLHICHHQVSSWTCVPTPLAHFLCPQLQRSSLTGPPEPSGPPGGRDFLFKMARGVAEARVLGPALCAFGDGAVGATRAQGQGHSPPGALTPGPSAGGHHTAGQDPKAREDLGCTATAERPGSVEASRLPRAGKVAESLHAHKVTLRVDSAPSPRVSFGDSQLPVVRKQLQLV